jgi:hypothetical protein
MNPFEDLYGRKCNVPISWVIQWTRLHLDPDMLKEMEQK